MGCSSNSALVVVVQIVVCISVWVSKPTRLGWSLEEGTARSELSSSFLSPPHHERWRARARALLSEMYEACSSARSPTFIAMQVYSGLSDGCEIKLFGLSFSHESSASSLVHTTTSFNLERLLLLLCVLLGCKALIKLQLSLYSFTIHNTFKHFTV